MFTTLIGTFYRGIIDLASVCGIESNKVTFKYHMTLSGGGGFA